MAVPVDIYVNDESPSPVPLANVEIALFDPGTHNMVASAMSDVNGKATLSLPGSSGAGTLYEVRFFKLGVNFHGLQTIGVVDPPLSGAPNKFDHTGADSNLLPLSSSPYLCRCTGVWIDFQGHPIPNKPLRFMSKAEDICKTPKITNGMMVSPDELTVMTDINGRVSLDLIRTGQYYVTWGGDDDTVWLITVPDRYSANLVDLIHPFPVLLDWDDTDAPSDAVTLVSQQSKSIHLLVTFSDFHTQFMDLDPWFDFVCSDGSVVVSAYSNGVLALTGYNPGTATITPTLKPGILPNRWPVPTPVLPPLTVTVS